MLPGLTSRVSRPITSSAAISQSGNIAIAFNPKPLHGLPNPSFNWSLLATLNPNRNIDPRCQTREGMISALAREKSSDVFMSLGKAISCMVSSLQMVGWCSTRDSWRFGWLSGGSWARFPYDLSIRPPKPGPGYVKSHVTLQTRGCFAAWGLAVRTLRNCDAVECFYCDMECFDGGLVIDLEISHRSPASPARSSQKSVFLP